MNGRRGFTFGLVLLCVLAAWAGLAGRPSGSPLAAAEDAAPPLVRLQYATFDPLAGEPALASELRQEEASARAGLYLVQFVGPIQEGWKQTLAGQGTPPEDAIGTRRRFAYRTADGTRVGALP